MVLRTGIPVLFIKQSQYFGESYWITWWEQSGVPFYTLGLKLLIQPSGSQPGSASQLQSEVGPQGVLPCSFPRLYPSVLCHQDQEPCCTRSCLATVQCFRKQKTARADLSEVLDAERGDMARGSLMVVTSQFLNHDLYRLSFIPGCKLSPSPGNILWSVGERTLLKLKEGCSGEGIGLHG